MSIEKKIKENKRTYTGAGVPSTALFRIANFELFVKQNKYVMGAGICGITFCMGYLFYMNYKARLISTGNTYVALNEDDTQTLRPRSSKWD